MPTAKQLTSKTASLYFVSQSKCLVQRTGVEMELQPRCSVRVGSSGLKCELADGDRKRPFQVRSEERRSIADRCRQVRTGADRCGQVRTGADSRGQLRPGASIVVSPLAITTCDRHADSADSADSCFPDFYSLGVAAEPAAPADAGTRDKKPLNSP